VKNEGPKNHNTKSEDFPVLDFAFSYSRLLILPIEVKSKGCGVKVFFRRSKNV